MIKKILIAIRVLLWIFIVSAAIFIYVSPNVRVIPKHFGESIDPAFQTCVNSFNNFTGNKKFVPIQFSDKLQPGILGVTYKIPFVPEIEISQKDWEWLGEGQCFLIWHELAHAVYDVQHSNESYKDGCAKSVMNAYLPGVPCLRAHFIEYLLDFAQLTHKDRK